MFTLFYFSSIILSMSVELLGFNTHKTFLGNYRGNEVVVCKDFITEGTQFVPFNDVGESSIEVNK